MGETQLCDLLLCDGQDGRSPASHAIDATLTRDRVWSMAWRSTKVSSGAIDRRVIRMDPRAGTCKKTCHVKCDGLRSVPGEDWYCVDCREPQCGPSCICRTKKRRA